MFPHYSCVSLPKIFQPLLLTSPPLFISLSWWGYHDERIFRMSVGPSISYHWSEGTHFLLLTWRTNNSCLTLVIAWQTDSPLRHYLLIMACLRVLNSFVRPAPNSSARGLRWAETIQLVGFLFGAGLLFSVCTIQKSGWSCDHSHLNVESPLVKVKVKWSMVTIKFIFLKRPKMWLDFLWQLWVLDTLT